MMSMENKPKIMLHVRALNQISGPNVCNMIIFNSNLKDKFQFEYLVHNPVRGFIDNMLIIFDLVKQIKKSDPDIVHIAGLQRAGFEGVMAARLCKKKVLLTIHGSSTDVINFNKKFLYAKILEPITMWLSHKVYTVCQAMADREHIKKNTRHNFMGTIHNSAPIVNKDAIKLYGLRSKMNIDEDAVIVSVVGRMVFDKGITYIADAIKKTVDKNIVFVFIGEGPLIEEMTLKLSDEIAEKKVILMGKQNNVLSILKECDIFLFATLHENLSNALLEACALGLAVIATNVGGNPEVIKDGYNGILIPPANSDKIVEAVKLLTNDKAVRLALGTLAKENVNKYFSQELLLQKLEKVYNEMYNSK